MIFIGCLPRAGSSLLRVVLDSHPDVHAGPETGWLRAESPREELLRDMRACSGRRYVNKLPANLSVPALTLLEELQGHLGQVFCFIHIYRNPFDTISSYLKTIEPAHEARHEFARDAAVFMAGYERFRKTTPFRAIEISYEDLVRETRRTLLRVCDLLDLPLVEDMLRHHELDHQAIDHYSDRNAGFPIFTSSIGQYDRYRDQMDEETTRLCRKLAELLPPGGREHWRGSAHEECCGS